MNLFNGTTIVSINVCKNSKPGVGFVKLVRCRLFSLMTKCLLFYLQTSSCTSKDSGLKNGIYSLGKLPDLSKLDLHTLQYNLISFDGNSAPQFLHV